MNPQKILHYDAPHRFEPLMPSEHSMGPLLERASDLSRAAIALGSSTAASAQVELRGLLRAMNSYYTQRIEGEHTRPVDIERALHQQFSRNADLARRQRLALAHISAEKACEDSLDGQDSPQGKTAGLYSGDSLQWLHRSLFEPMKPQDLVLSDGSSLVPGAWRTRQVAVGRHEAPLSSALPRFIARWAAVYGAVRRGEASIVAAAASHHRLAWMHPFLDGNGRVARLHTHLLLHAMGLTRGLWSPLRGFARSEARYKSLLAAADEHRRGDLDGRGNLTQQGLIEWIAYTLDTCIDQVDFMARQLDVGSMRERMAAALHFEAGTARTGVRVEALPALHYLFATHGELGRAEFKAMTGLGERTATQLVSTLLRRGYVATDSAYGKLRFAIPRHALRFYFPALWPEAEQDAAVLEAEQRQAP